MARIEWRLLEVGHCVHPECGAMRGGRWRLCEFPALVALLRHPSRGWFVFDTGYSQRFFEATARLPAALYRWTTPVSFDPAKGLAAQLRALGIDAAELRGVVLSHFHADHVAGLLDLPALPVFCSRAGWTQLRSRGSVAALAKGLLVALAPPALDSRLAFFEDAPARDAPRWADGFDAHDVLGDGSLLAVALPGHAVGHFGLAFRDEDDAPVLLAGDAAWSSRAIRENRPPPAWVTGLLSDTRAYRSTLERLHAAARREPELRIVPSHCGEWRP